MREKHFKNDYIEMWIENGVIHAVYAPFIELTKEAALTIVEERHKLTEGKTYPVFADVRKAKTMTKEVRKVFSSPESTRGICAGAFLIKTQIEVFLVNSWLSLSPPPLPTKLFTEKEKALDWLEQFKRIN